MTTTGQRSPTPDLPSGHQRTTPGRLRPFAIVVGVVSLVALGAVANAAAGEPESAGQHKLAAPTTTADLSGQAPAPPPVGDDPALDALAQACSTGDLVACDQLFLQSPVDSDYEAYGDTCAGLQPAGTEQWCAIGMGTTPTTPTPSSEPGEPSGEPVLPTGLGTDPELDALAQACYVGDMEACDDLYFAAGSGSAYQEYGDTCAGRQPANTGRVCTSLENPVPGTGVVETTTPGGPTTSAPVGPTTPGDTTTTPGPTQPTVPGQVPPPTLQPTGLGTDPELDALAQACFNGDLLACDNLYRGSEPGSAYRSYGDTCAGRQPERTGVWCVDAFGAAPSTTGAPATTGAVPLPPSTVPPVATTVPPVATTVPPVATTVPPVAPTTAPPFDPSSTTTATTAGVIPPPTLQPTGLGTDPTLDALAQSCYDGDLAACDSLFQQAEADSAYQDYGDTCAGRQPANSGVWCVDAFPAASTTTVPGATTLPGPTTPGPTTPGPTTPGPTTPGAIPPPTQQPTGLGTDPALDALAQSCYDGDMQACDTLFDQSPVGSPYETYGDTCAGRQPPGTFNYCRVAFPGTGAGVKSPEPLRHDKRRPTPFVVT